MALAEKRSLYRLQNIHFVPKYDITISDSMQTSAYITAH